MTSRVYSELINRRLAELDIPVAEKVVEGCCEYLRLLEKWNRTINLTALGFHEVQLPRTVDKLIVEPLIGASLLQSVQINPKEWIDLGSGGGSPALPLRLACGSGRQTMVEARARKCAFLREAVRQLGLSNTAVLSKRFEQLKTTNGVDLITVRAVRLDDEFGALVTSLLTTGGFVLSFGNALTADGITPIASRLLPDSSTLHLSQRLDVPRGTI